MTTTQTAIDWQTATPREFDTELAGVYGRYSLASRTRDGLWNAVHYAAGDSRVYRGHFRATWKLTHDEALTAANFTDPTTVASLLAAQEDVDALSALITHCGEVFVARGRWTRAWLVTGGHVHSTTACRTCFPTTEFGWLPQVSGLDESEIVDQAGELACTVCYPTAPVSVLRQPCRLETAAGQVERERREAEAAERARKAAAKAAKAIFAPDGSPLRDQHGLVIASEVTAQREAVDALAQTTLWARRRHQVPEGVSQTAAEWAARCTRNSADDAGHAVRLLAALAAKRGTTVEALVLELAKKADRKIREYAW
jgi:hypothetical protein